MATNRFIQAFDQAPQQPLNGASDSRTAIDSFNNDIDYDINFPEITSETVDQALFNWFDEANPLFVRDREDQPKKVKVVLSTYERWSMIRIQTDMRDVHGQLKLPIFSIKRNDVQAMEERTASVDQAGTANFKLYVHEKINSQTNKKEYAVLPGKDNKMTVVEVIEIQPPKITAFTYTVIFWSDYMLDLNDAQQHMQLKFGKRHAIYFNEHLWFHARMETTSNNSNDEAVDNNARIFKTNFSITVEAPLISKDNIISRKTAQGAEFSMQVAKDASLGQTLSDKIRDTIDWNNPYKLRR